MNNESVIVAFITGVLTYLGTKKQVKGNLQSKQIEAQVTSESVYVQNMSTILEEYKDQVASFRVELKTVKEDFDSFKKQHFEEIEEYRAIVASKDERIEELEEENIELKEENTYLKSQQGGE